MARVVQGLHQRLAQEAGAGQRAVEPAVRGHLQDGGNAAAFLAHHDAPGIAELDLAAGVGAVAYLVLQTLDLDGVLAAVGAPARHEEAGGAGIGIGQHQVGIRHRRGEEPLVAGDHVLGAAPFAAAGHRAGSVGAHVRSALLLRHAHAHVDRTLLLDRDVAWVIGLGQQLVAELREQPGLLAQHRDAGLGHVGGAQRAGLDLAVHIQRGRIRGPCRGARIGEGQVGEPAAARNGHHLVPAGMETHLVDAFADARMRVQLGVVAVGVFGVADGLLGAEHRALALELRLVPACTGARNGAADGGVAGVEVVVLKLGNLVGDDVGGVGSLGSVHDGLSPWAGLAGLAATR